MYCPYSGACDCVWKNGADGGNKHNIDEFVVATNLVRLLSRLYERTSFTDSFLFLMFLLLLNQVLSRLPSLLHIILVILSQFESFTFFSIFCLLRTEIEINNQC